MSATTRTTPDAAIPAYLSQLADAALGEPTANVRETLNRWTITEARAIFRATLAKSRQKTIKLAIVR